MLRTTALLVLLTGCASGALPRAAIHHNAAGAELLARGDLDEAEASFRLALEYHPRFVEPRANLAIVALARGDLEPAEAHLRTAIRLNPDFALAWSTLGVVMERRGRPEEAADAYEHALSIDPGLAGPRSNLAALLARREDFAAARAHLMRLVRVATDDADAHALLAYVELRLGRPAEAVDRAERVLASHPQHPMARVVRGAARAQRGELDAAAEDLRAATDDPVAGRHARTRLAAVEALRGDRAEAERLLAALLREDPDDPAARLVAEYLANP